MKLFLNPDVSCYLRELADEFGASPNALKGELDNLSEAGYLEREQNGRSVYFRANREHPFFPEISSIVRKTLGIDHLIDEVVTSLGDVETVYVLDDYALGRDTGVIDLLIVGNIDRAKLEKLRAIAEKKIDRLIRVINIRSEDWDSRREVVLARPHWKIL
jgi:DNA-binding transcriptional ArsR family regulator